MKRFFNKVFRQDHWQNRLTNIGSSLSRTNQAEVKEYNRLTYSQLSSLYSNNGLAKRIVQCLVDDAVRSGFFNSANDDLKKEFKRLKVNNVLKEAGYFSRLYGGSLILLIVDDGLGLEEPLNEKRINKIANLKVYNRHWIFWNVDDLVTDPYHPNYSKPAYYSIQPPNIGNEKPILKVHYSRCIILDGLIVDNLRRATNQGWGDSVFISCYEVLKHYDLTSVASVEIVQDFIQVIVKLNDLDQKMIRQNGRKDIHDRLEALDLSRSISNTILVDANKEDYEKKASTVTGLSDLWTKFEQAICGATGYPMTRLFGQSPGGLNSTGVSDMRNYYDLVSAYRTDEMEYVIDRLINLILLQKEYKGDKDSSWSFNSLVEQTDLERAELKEKHAKIDWGYIDRGAIDPRECWQERFGSGEFKENIKLKPLEKEEFSDDDVYMLDKVAMQAEAKEKQRMAKKEDALVNDKLQQLYDNL